MAISIFISKNESSVDVAAVVVVLLAVVEVLLLLTLFTENNGFLARHIRMYFKLSMNGIKSYSE